MKIDIERLAFIDPTLREILLLLEEQTGVEFTITSLYRIDDDGVHGTLPLRGTDLRTRSTTIGVAAESLINNHWEYDPKRPDKKCALLHGDGPNLHLHVQVHPNTRRRV